MGLEKTLVTSFLDVRRGDAAFIREHEVIGDAFNLGLRAGVVIRDSHLGPSS